MAAASVAADFNKSDIELFQSKTYVLLGDGCLQEGVASEACSLAGHLKLHHLLAIHDSNRITIDGDTSLSFSENVEQRFHSYGWDVLNVEDGHMNLVGIVEAVKKAQQSKDKPTLIIVRTVIGYGCKLQNTAKSHGAPIGEADIKALRERCGFSDDMWDVPAKAIEHMRAKGAEGDSTFEAWTKKAEAYKASHPEDWAELERRFSHKLKEGWQSALPRFTAADKAEATRSLSEKVLNALRPYVPELVGGSADLAESNKTMVKGDEDCSAANPSGKRIRFGVREHGMVAICNGMFAYGCFRPYGATFLNFYTYAWGAVRLAALSHFGVILIASHDSIDLGEDGPTHQPIETAPLMRATPNLNFMRPCDGNETSGAYAVALEDTTIPTVLALSRGNCPHIENTSVENVRKGAYILQDFDANRKGKKIVIAASGTEVQEAVSAAKTLREAGANVRVVSMPSWYLFELQSKEYQHSVLPQKSEAVCVYIEASGNFGWARYFDESLSCGMTTFGASAPAGQLKKEFKITGEALVEKIKAAYPDLSA
eukprot:Protomagalhaensia_wolfi_Nauph_80__135@NODE_1077_length_1756_cov_12_806639_g819_i0_p1_GENE_NODE_1077_length_1756_cov_12_806639_g819_i0NODE_1077_length_1756_cov_12_806639_g819_i0_p1_ORF_typecomplete_len561_score154_06Transketolase_N/PF00456_21/1_6e60Transket_pyr/PF02779_24/6_9e36Transketolase_C/PF02780_20/6_7e03Transketolase_C/PF02780_20/9_7e14E1_dh/PF00676_20/9_2e07XFP_C/PF09363_10/7_6e02XFP_C/PF09363_10/0_0013DXP_synthase_N/PF13292_6/0_012DXP_synthase_N/PF13292_6/79Toprim_3/PF13362_6/1_5e04Topri